MVLFCFGKYGFSLYTFFNIPHILKKICYSLFILLSVNIVGFWFCEDDIKLNVKENRAAPISFFIKWMVKFRIAQSARAVEYTDCTSAEG